MLALILLALLTGCQSTPASDSNRLYDHLGERDGISALTETLLLTIAADPRIADDFRGTDINRVHRMLTDFICVIADGPCNYTGDDMANVHRGLEISSTEFNALVEALVLSMEQRGIATGAQNRLLAKLAPLRRDIVDAPAQLSPELRQLILGDLDLYRYSAPRADQGL
ncbi:cyanoglobin family protein [Salinisphaera dokdonensis CL-ES53]|uniref:Cyanoglobin family protein n=1 Tax=Salinisphaera dokdonensis CL-ES53 TaxID=1304272 RepID=A0ABV2B1U1_9GAMM